MGQKIFKEKNAKVISSEKGSIEQETELKSVNSKFDTIIDLFEALLVYEEDRMYLKKLAIEKNQVNLFL